MNCFYLVHSNTKPRANLKMLKYIYDQSKLLVDEKENVVQIHMVKSQTCKWLATFSLVKPGTFISSRILLGTASEMKATNF